MVIGDFKGQHNYQPLGPGLPHAARARCRLQVHPHSSGLGDRLNHDQTNPTLIRGGLGTGDSPLEITSWIDSNANATVDEELGEEAARFWCIVPAEAAPALHR